MALAIMALAMARRKCDDGGVVAGCVKASRLIISVQKYLK